MNPIPCKFANYHCRFGHGQYTCIIEEQTIPANFSIKGFSGQHQGSSTVNNVIAVRFIETNILRIPKNLTEFFKNLHCLTLNNCGLEKIEKTDLQGLKNLLHLDLANNSIKSIPGDLFCYNNQLQNFSIAKNKLTVIGSDLFNNFDRFYFIDFRDNPAISTFFEHQRFNDQFQKFKNFKAKFKASFVEVEIAALKAENCQLREENQKLKLEITKLKDEKLELLEDTECLAEIDNILNDERFSDFTFVVESKEFKVHKFIFIARSQLFREMMLENPDADRLILRDIPIDLFKQILKFVYTDELLEDGSDFVKLFVAASKLKIEMLKKKAAQKLIEYLNAENSYEILVMCQKLNHQELKMKAFTEFTKDFPELPVELADDLGKLIKIIDTKKAMEELKKTLEQELESVKLKK